MNISDTQELFARHSLELSRFQAEKLSVYENLLHKWQKAINLVGPSTLSEIVTRHFLDSAQMMRFLSERNATLVDMGSGAGFPGLVLAILGMDNVHLIESDQRKATFLQSVSRETKTKVTVHAKRVEECQIPNVDIVTARALAPMTVLLSYMNHFNVDQKCQGLFLKGKSVDEELKAAQNNWGFIAQTLDGGVGSVVHITHLQKKCFT